MRILHGDGFRLREREEARETVISNLVMKFIIMIMMIMIMIINLDDDDAGYLCVPCPLSDGAKETLQ